MEQTRMRVEKHSRVDEVPGRGCWPRSCCFGKRGEYRDKSPDDGKNQEV